MILGLCSSCAVVPAVSMVTGGGGSNRRSVRLANRPDLISESSADVSASAIDPVSPAAKPMSGASLSAMFRRIASTSLPSSAASAAAAAAPSGPAGPHVSTGHSQHGVASWLDISAGTCANNAAPMGAIVTVTSVAGTSITCKVVSRGPFGRGRVVDLAKSTFAALQPPSRGLVDVSVSW